MPVSATEKNQSFDITFMGLHLYRYASYFSKLHGIAKQINRYLSKPGGSPMTILGVLGSIS